MLESEADTDDDEPIVLDDDPNTPATPSTINLDDDTSSQGIIELTEPPETPTHSPRKRRRSVRFSPTVFIVCDELDQDGVRAAAGTPPLRCRLRSHIREEQERLEFQTRLESAAKQQRAKAKQTKPKTTKQPSKQAKFRGCKSLQVPVLLSHTTITRMRLLHAWKTYSKKCAESATVRPTKKRRRYRAIFGSTKKKKRSRAKSKDDEDNESMAAAVEAALNETGGSDDAQSSGDNCDEGDDDDVVDLEELHQRDLRRWAAERTKFDHIFKKKQRPSADDIEAMTSGQATASEKKRRVEENAPTSGQVILLQKPASPADLSLMKKKASIFRLVSGDAGIACKFCDHVCGRNTPIQRHLDNHHHFRCETCVVAFRTAKELRKHREDNHHTHYRCDVCEKEYMTQRKFDFHLKSRSHQQLESAQVKLLNVIVNKLKLNQTMNIRPLEGALRDEIISCKVAKERRRFGPGERPNVQIMSSNVVGYFLEHTERSENHRSIVECPLSINIPQPSFVNNMPYSNIPTSSDQPQHTMDMVYTPLQQSTPGIVMSMDQMTTQSGISIFSTAGDAGMTGGNSTTMAGSSFAMGQSTMTGGVSIIDSMTDDDYIPMYETMPKTSVVADRAIVGCDIMTPVYTAPIDKPVQSKREVLKGAGARILQQVLQAFDGASPDVLEQAYEIGLLKRPTDAIAVEAIEADAVDNPGYTTVVGESSSTVETTSEMCVLQNVVIDRRGTEDTLETGSGNGSGDVSNETDESNRDDAAFDDIFGGMEIGNISNSEISEKEIDLEETGADTVNVAATVPETPAALLTNHVPLTTLTVADLDGLLDDFRSDSGCLPSSINNCRYLGDEDNSPLLSSINVLPNEDKMEMLSTTIACAMCPMDDRYETGEEIYQSLFMDFNV